MDNKALQSCDAPTWFGNRAVTTAEKTRLVGGVFASVASRYDIMNDLMSAGVHRLWKAALINRLRPRAGMHLLDAAGGTGDIALRVRRRLGSTGRVTVCDINPAMLSVGVDRAFDRGYIGHGDGAIDWLAGNAEALPLADASVDAYTIAFGLRNVTGIVQALQEARRVLRPGGHFLCLEFSHVVVPGLDRAYARYCDTVLPRLGAAVAGDRGAYEYLVESIRRFPSQAELAAMIEAAGLDRVVVQNLSGGIAAIHGAWRL